MTPEEIKYYLPFLAKVAARSQNPGISGAGQGVGNASALGFGLDALANSPTTAGKVLGGGSAALGGANLVNQIQPGTIPGVEGAGGTALGLAGVGYNLANIAQSDLSTENKVGAGVKSGGEALAAYALPYGWVPAIADALGGQLQKSGSPQIKATGRGLSSAGTPIPTNPFGRENVANPAPELKGLGTSLLVGGPGGSALLNAIGIDPTKFLSKIMPGIFHTPTTGTQFRRGLGQVFKKAGVAADTDQYHIDPAKYEAFSPEARDQALQLGKMLGANSDQYKKDPESYGIQTSNILLNKYGEDVKSLFAKLLGSK